MLFETDDHSTNVSKLMQEISSLISSINDR